MKDIMKSASDDSLSLPGQQSKTDEEIEVYSTW
jgi:hypothetical protein